MRLLKCVIAVCRDLRGSYNRGSGCVITDEEGLLKHVLTSSLTFCDSVMTKLLGHDCFVNIKTFDIQKTYLP